MNNQLIGSIENHRGREEGVLVYPVYSRRSQGLSMGINLFPDHKRCSFNCPYCEVFPFKTNSIFSLEYMERALQYELSQAKRKELTVRDICFSGNGEPTLSPYFSGALDVAAQIRDRMVPEANLVVITNGTGLLDAHLFEVLRHTAMGPMNLNIWLKLDAGTPGWYGEMARSTIPYASLVNKIKELVGLAPVTIQTMVCKVQGKVPPPEEVLAWEKLLVELTHIGIRDIGGIRGYKRGHRRGIGIRDIQIYGKARPAPEDPLAEALPLSYLEARTASLRRTIEGAGLNLSIGLFP